MAGRFSQENQRVRPNANEDPVIKRAQEHFERSLIKISGEFAGSVAALEHPADNEALNYGEVFLRDNVPTLPTSIQGRNIAIARVFFISGTGSASSNSLIFID